MQKNTKNAKIFPPKNTPKFSAFFRENRAVANCREVRKRVEKRPRNSPKIPRAHFFSRNFSGGTFSGVFRNFQLKIEEKKCKKRAFFRCFFGKNFVFFFVLPAGGRRSHFLHEAKIRTSLFWSKSAEHVFGFLVRFCAVFTRQNRSGKKNATARFYPYRPLVAQGGVSFPYVFFVQIPGFKSASETRPWTILQYYYIGIESRGGVDVIPFERIFEKRVFLDFKLKVPFLTIFSGENFVHFGKPRS